jgi:hypothetical protein
MSVVILKDFRSDTDLAKYEVGPDGVARLHLLVPSARFQAEEPMTEGAFDNTDGHFVMPDQGQAFLDALLTTQSSYFGFVISGD